MASFARVLNLEGENMTLQDLQSKTEVRARVRGEAAYELKDGDEALFLGHMLSSGVFEVKRWDKRKLLSPLYEKDLFGASGRFTMLEPVDNPFTEAFLQYQDQLYKDSNAERLLTERDSEQGSSSTPASLPA